MAGDKYAALRAEFVAGTMTLAELARAHGVSYEPLRRASERQGWQALRQESAENVRRVTENVRIEARNAEVGRAAANALDRLARVNERALKIAEALDGEIVRGIQEARASGEAVDAAKVNAWAAANERNLRASRTALGEASETHELRGGLTLAQLDRAQVDAMMREVLQE